MPGPDVLTSRAPRITVAERPAPGRATQDRWLLLPHAVAVLDGATDPAEPHGRDGGWYAQCLADALGNALAVEAGIPGAVEDAIREVADRHALIPGVAPSSTVAVAAWLDDQVHAYALGDSSVIAIHTDGHADVLTDDRLQRVGAEQREQYRRRLADGHGYDATHRRLLRELVRVERQHRNHADGYWIAEAVPDAAQHGLTASWPRRDLRGLILATDGASAAVERGHIADWLTAWQQIAEHGPERILAWLEDAEGGDPDGTRWSRSKPSDDKTLVVVRLA